MNSLLLLLKDPDMKQWSLALALVFITPLSFADDLSDDCIKSMQNVYKFYYHEILPKDKDSKPEKLGQLEAAQMQEVIGSLKTNCSPELITKMNLLLQSEEVAQG